MVWIKANTVSLFFLFMIRLEVTLVTLLLLIFINNKLDDKTAVDSNFFLDWDTDLTRFKFETTGSYT